MTIVVTTNTSHDGYGVSNVISFIEYSAFIGFCTCQGCVNDKNTLWNFMDQKNDDWILKIHFI